MTARHKFCGHKSNRLAAIRTLSMRLRGTSVQELEEMGEDADGAIEVVSKLEEKLYSLAGVHVTDLTGELRSTYDIMNDLAKVWGSLDTNRQASILETIAGKNRSSDIAAMLRNWQSVENAVQAATDAEGTAANEQAIYMESLQGHLDVLSATWQEFATNLISSDFLKFFVDLGSGALEALSGITSFIDAMGGMPTVIMAVVAALMLAKDGMIAYNIAQHLVAGGKAVIHFFTGIVPAIKNMVSSLSLAGTAWRLYGIEAATASEVMQASIPVIGLVLAAITAVVAGFTLYNNKQKEAAEATGSAAKEEASSITELYNAYKDAQSAYDSNTGSKESLDTATNNLLTALGYEASQIETLTGKYGDLDEAINQVTIDSLKKSMTDMTTGYENAVEELIDAADGNLFDSGIAMLSGGNEKLGTVFTDVLEEAGLISTGSNGNKGGFAFVLGNNGQIETLEDVVAAYEDIVELQDALEDGIAQGKYTREELASSGIWGVLSGALAQIKDEYKEVFDYIDGINDAASQIQIMTWEKDNPIPKTVSEFKAFREEMIQAAMDSGNFVGSQADIERSFDTTIGKMTEFSSVADMYERAMSVMDGYSKSVSSDGQQKTQEQIDAFNDWIYGLSSDELSVVFQIGIDTDTADWELADWQNAVNNYEPPEFISDEEESKLNGLPKALKALADGYDVVQKAQKDMAAGKGITADTIQAMSSYLEDGEDITQYLIRDEYGYLQLDVDAWNNRAAAMMIADETAIDRQIQALQEENAELEQAGINYEEIAEKMKEFQTGNVDLVNRPVISGADMKKAGWANAGDGYATLFSSTFTAGTGFGYDFGYDQNVVVDITPIMPNGEVLSPEALESYMAELLQSDNILEADAIENGGLGLVLNVSEVTGTLDEAIAASEEWTTSLHDLQAEYYAIEGNEVTIRSLKDLRSVYESLWGTVEEGYKTGADLPSMFDGLEDVGKKSQNLRDALEQLSKGTALSRDELEALATEYPELMQVDGLFDMTDVADQQAALEGVYSSFESQFNALIDAQLTLLEAARAEAEEEGKSTSVFDAMISNLTSIKDGGISGLFDTDETKKVVTQYDLMSDAISGVKKASDTLTEINSNDRDVMSIFSSITEMAEKSGQSITDFVSVVDGQLTFNEDAITSWATNLVNKMDEIPGMTEEIKAAFIEQIKAEEEASKAYDDMSTAIGNVSKASSLLTDIQEFNITGDGNTLDMLSDIVDMAEATGQSVSDFVTVVDGQLQFSEDAIKSWANSFIDSLDVDDSVKQYLKDQVTSTYEATKAYEELSTAMDKVNAASDYLTKINDSDATFMDKFSAAIKMLEEMPEGTTIDDLLTFDEDGQFSFKTEAVTNWINGYIDDMVTAGTVSAELGEQMKSAASAVEEQVSSYDKVAEAISNAQKAAGLLTDLHAADFDASDAMSALETVTDMAKATGQDISDFVTVVDGELKFDEEAIKAWSDTYIDALLGIEGLPPEIAEEIREIVKANEELVDSYQTLSTAVGNINTASGLLTDIDEYKATGKGDTLGMFSTIVAMAEDTKQPITDFFSFIDGEIQFNEAAITGWSESFIDSLDVGDDVKEYLKGQVKSTYEAADGFKALSDAISNVNSVSGYLTKISADDVSFIDVMSDAVALLEKMPEGTTLDDFFQINDDGSITYLTDSVTNWINGYIDDMVTAGTVSAELGEQMKSAAQAELEQESAFDKLSNTMSKVSSAASLLQKAYDEIAESGKNSIETLSSLMSLYGEEWTKYVNFSDDGSFVINSDAIIANMYDAIDAIEGASPEMKQALKNSLEVDIKKDEFSSVVDSYVSDVEKLNDALEKLKKGELTNSDIYELIKEFPELAAHTDNLGEAINNMLGQMDSKMFADFNKALSECKTEEEREQLIGLMEVITNLRESADEPVKITIEILTEGFENVYTAMEESNSVTGLSAESMSNLIERYQELEDFDIAELFERSAEGIKLNTEAMTELEEAYEAQIKSKLGDTIDDLVEQYDSLTEQLNNASDAATYADLYSQREAVMQKINDAANLMAQYYGLTSAYNKWKAAQSGGEQGDTYDDAKSGLDKVKELYSDGLIGTEEFKAGVGFMTGKDVDNMTPQEIAAAYEEAYPRVSKFFEDGTKGCENFLKALKDKGWASFEDGVWKLGDAETGILDVEKAAADLGVSVDLIYALMGKLSDYGFDIDFSSGIIDLDNVVSKGEEAEAILNKLGKNTYHFDFNATDLNRLNEQIVVAQDNLKQFYKTGENGEFITDENGNYVIDMSIEGAEEAQYVLAALMAQAQEVSKPYVMTIDTTNFSGAIGETLRNIQAVQTAYNNLQIQAAVGADTTQAQSDLDAAIANLKGGDVEILASLGIDTTSESTIISTIEGINPEVLVSVGIDETTLASATTSAQIEGTVSYTVNDAAVIAFESASHSSNGTVVWSNNGSAVSSYANSTKKAKGVVTWSNNTSAVKTSFTATGTVKWKNSTLAAGTAHANGSAFAVGTAFRSGNWGVKGSGVALGGEVGQELVVRKGKFFTIGDDGAEFFHYKKDDIIFNAAQTKELFEKGKVISGGGRGRAYVDGTAFGAGSYSGGGSFYKPKTSITKSKTASSKTGSGTSNTTSKTKKDDKDKVDWIEIAIERIEVAIETLANIADNAYRTLAKRMNAAADEIAEVTDEIALQQKAYDRYMKEADSVKLDNKIKELVKSGAIDITEYTKDTVDLINEYKEWIDKANECSEAIEELHMTLAELYTARFEMVQQDAESQIALLEHMTNTFSNSLDLIEAKGYLGGKALYNQMAAVQSELIKKYKTEIADMQILMSEAVGSGEMDIGSEEYYNMQQSINEVKEALQEAQIAFEDYNNSIRQANWDIFDYLEDRISKIVDESNFLIELIGDADLFNEQGIFNENGEAVLGLRAVNYNTYMSQADQYAREIKQINDELMNDPLDTALIERKEELISLQQDSILAAEGEKAAIQDLVESGINAELAAIKQLIDEYNESLQSSKD